MRQTSTTWWGKIPNTLDNLVPAAGAAPTVLSASNRGESKHAPVAILGNLSDSCVIFFQVRGCARLETASFAAIEDALAQWLKY